MPLSKGTEALKTKPLYESFYNGHEYVIEESLSYLVKQMHMAIQHDIDLLMQPLDLTAMQWGPLLLISHGKCHTAADVARYGSVDTGAVTRMLDRLEDKGLVIRKRSQEDRRIVNLVLTDAGHEISEKIPFVLADCLNKRLRGFTKAEVETFTSLLRRMLGNDER